MPFPLLGAAAEYLSAKFGGPIADKTATATIGVAAASLIDRDPDRLSLVIVNLSANTVYVGFSADVSSSKGIRLNASGGSLSLDIDSDQMLVTNQIWAVASGAGSDVYSVTLNRIVRTGVG